jgi:hypothetical protein
MELGSFRISGSARPVLDNLLDDRAAELVTNPGGSECKMRRSST